jgi:hypothetical protein
MSQNPLGNRQELIPPSLSDLSHRSASSETLWQSPSSTSSRKHSLELAFDGSPQPKRRLLADMASAATAFRYSAPCPQSSFGPDGSERRGGFLRRSGVPIQALLAATETHGPSPSIAAYFASEWEAGAETNSALHDPFCPRPRPSNRPNITSAPNEQQQVRKKKVYSFWRLTSPAVVEPAVPEASLVEEEPTSNKVPLPGPKSAAHTARLSMNRPGSSTRTHQETAPQGMVSAGLAEDEGGAQERRNSAQDNNNSGNKGCGEEKPIIMCGKRLYSDWTGNWSRLFRNLSLVRAQMLTCCYRWYSTQDSWSRGALPRGLPPSGGQSGTLGMSRAGLSDHLRGRVGSGRAL